MLIAHYPLNGDTLDYSGNKYTWRHPNSFIDNGKIGKAFVPTTGSFLSLKTSMFKNNQASLLFWLYNDSRNTATTTPLFESSETTSPQRNIFTCFQYPTRNDFHFDFRNSNGDVVFSAHQIITNVLPDNKWTHIAMVVNDKTLYIYLNGILINTQTSPLANYMCLAENRNMTFVGDFGTTRLNDVRFYNHPLSPSEVKEISKAKVVHYTFNNPYEESTKNVITNTNLDTGWDKSYCTAIRINDIQPPEGINSQVYSFINAGVSGNTGGYWYSYGDYAPQEPNNTYTISLYVRTRDINFRIMAYTADNNEVGRVETSYITVPNDNVWHRIVWAPILIPTNSTSDSLSFQFGFGSANNTEAQRTWICAPQMEKKDHATPFVNGIRDNKMISDSSDFGNHGIQTVNSVFISNDSTIGSSSFRSTKSHQVIKIPQHLIKSMTESTISFWHKSILPLADWMILNGNGTDTAYGGGNEYLMATGAGSGPFYHSNVGTPTIYRDGIVQTLPAEDQEWHHYVATGVNILSTWTNLYINNYLDIWDINGFIDDFRIYNTILSEADIKELYNTKLLVDTEGNNIFTNEIIENENLLDLDYIYQLGMSRTNEGNKPVKAMKFGVKTVGFSPDIFHDTNVDIGNITPDYISLVNGFKPNTQYLFDMFFIHNTIHNNVPTSGGLDIIYSDGSHFLLTTIGNNRWQRMQYISDINKTIAKVNAYYYTNGVVYYSYDSKIVEYKEIEINKKSQLLCSEFIEVKPYKPTLCDYTNWNQLGIGRIGNWVINGTDAENERMLAGNPYGDLDYMWVTPGNDASSGDDGGFVYTGCPVDRSKKYRLSIWMRRENNAGGYLYLGCQGNTVTGTNATEIDTNPYFAVINSTQDDWYLWVGHIHPSTYNSLEKDPDSGIYDINGAKRYECLNFKWTTNVVTSGIRAYLYYSSSPTEMAYFYRPRFEVCDGSEPSLQELLTCSEHTSMLLNGSNTLGIDKYGNTCVSSIIEN